jgi:uncharacterized protein
MKIQAYSTSSISEAIVAFAQFCRGHGLNVGVQETQDALMAATYDVLAKRPIFKNALCSIFCSSPEERLLYNRLFSLYWDTNPIDLKADRKNKTVVKGQQKNQAASLVMMGEGKSNADEEEAKNMSGANATERLRKTDFSKIEEIDAKLLEELADRLFKEMALRLRRRMKTSQTNGQINLRRTIRRSLSFGGEPLELCRKAQKPKRQRLIVLLDVSGSMDKYSFFLLRFICALKENFRQLESFVFSTSLIKITNSLETNQLNLILNNLAQNTNNWSSGTKIGECLEDFYDKYGKRTLNGSPIVIVLSDGLDTGEPALLGSVMTKIQRKARKVVWLNPLKGMRGYEPTARGMSAALPLVDDFRSAHNLDSLLELENILASV